MIHLLYLWFCLLFSKYKKADQEQTPGSDSVSDVLDVIGEEEAIEVQVSVNIYKMINVLTTRIPQTSI